MKAKLLKKQIFGILLFIEFLITSIPIFADGSKDLYPSGATGRRAFLLSRPSNTPGAVFCPFPSSGTHKVYVKAGETIYTGSSVQGVTNANGNTLAQGFCRINLRAPNGNTYTSGTSTTVGLIANRTEELAGPDRSGVTTGYTPFTRVVGAAEEGIWEVDFVYAENTVAGGGQTSTASGTNLTQDVTTRLYSNSFAGNFNWSGTGANGQPLEIVSSALILAWDVSVGSVANAATLVPGRVYVNNLNLTLPNNYPVDGGLKSTMYTLTNDGFVYRVKANGINGASWIYFSNNKGITTGGAISSNGYSGGTASYLSGNSTTTLPLHIQDPRIQDTATDVTHKLFFTTPASDLPANAATRYNGGPATTTWLKTTAVNPSITNLSIVGAEASTANVLGPDGANITFTTNIAGPYTITIDINNNGSYADAVDRTLTGTAINGSNSILWDGKDGNGGSVTGTPNVTIKVKGAMLLGEVHFPEVDVEINPNGLIIERVDPSTYLPISGGDLVYWNDSNIDNTTGSLPNTPSNPVTNTAGISSNTNGHKWGAEIAATPFEGCTSCSATDNSQDGKEDFGNGRILDTWNFLAISQEITQAISTITVDLAVNSITPNVTCTALGSTVSYAVNVRSLTNINANSVTNAPFKFTADAGFALTGYSFTSNTGTITESSVIPGTGTNVFSSNLSMTSGSDGTYTFTGTVGAPLVAGNKVNATASIMRPADIWDTDATKVDSPTLPPTDPLLECNGLPSGTGCNNIVTITNGPLIDNIPPTVTCPSNVVATSIAGSCNVTLTPGTPTTSDNCAGTTTLTWTASGAETSSGTGILGSHTFNPGTTTITYKATDAAGNTATCSFTVKVDPCADLVTVKTLTSATSTPSVGSTVQFTIKVTNNGPNEAAAVSLTDLIPAGLTLTGNAPSVGNYNTGTGLWNGFSLLPSANATLVLTATVNAGQSGNTITNNTTKAVSPEHDPTDAGNDLAETITVLSSGSVAGTVKDAAGNPLVGVTITLSDGNPATTDPTTTTDATGAYIFNNVTPGEYTVVETNPSGYNDVSDSQSSDGDTTPNTNTNDNSIPVTVAAGEADVANNFVDSNLGSVAGTVKDAAGNPLVGVTITLSDGNPATTDPTTTTDATGAYIFNNVTPGEYTVVETNPSGYNSVSDAQSSDGDTTPNTNTNDDSIPVTVAAGEADVANNFVDTNLGSVAGTVKDAAGNPLVGVTITLSDGNPATTDPTTTTDATGAYIFNNVTPGEYTVVETNPSGYSDVSDSQSSDGDTTPNTNTNDNSIPVTVAAGEADVANNFVDTNLGSVAGTVKDAAGNPLVGVTITLSDGNPATTDPTTTTDATGAYIFNNVTPGEYTVVETNPSGYSDVSDSQSSDGDTTPNTNTNDNSIPVTVAAGEADVANNFVDTNLGSVAGTVKDAAGNPLVGVTITLSDGNPATTDPTTTTDATGAYIFNNVTPGEYTVVETNPSGYSDVSDSQSSDGDTTPNTNTNDNSIPVTVAAGEADVANNFVDTNLGSVAGTVKDAAGNPLVGVTITLSDGNPATTDPTTTTDATGAYIFNNVTPGEYTVVETNPSGYSDVSDSQSSDGDTTPNTNTNDNSIPVTVAAGEADVANNFVDSNLGSVAGTVKDAAGNPLVGVTITLSDGNPATTDPTTTTDATGAYIFNNVTPGEYTLVETNPSGYNSVSDAQSSDGDTTPNTNTNDDSIPVTVAAGEADVANNFVDTNLGSVAGTVKDAAGNPLVGVTITLSDGNPATTDPTTTTDATGAYIFNNVTPGEYTVVETNPSGYSDVSDSQSSDGDTTPNTNTNDNSIPVTVAAGEADVANNFVDESCDLEIGGVVYFDKTGTSDGVGGNPIDGTITPITITLTKKINNLPVIVAFAPINNVGTYKFTNIPPGTYSLIMTTNSTGSTSVSLPSGFNTVSEGGALGKGLLIDGIPLGASSGDGTVDGKTTIVVDCNAIVYEKLPNGRISATASYLTNNFGIVNPTALPIDLVSFQGTKLENTINLSWKTANEKEFSHFEIQKSENAKEFGSIGTVLGKKLSNYNFIDQSPKTGSNYYRLKMVDLDGKFIYSKTINVDFENNISLIILENPTTNGLIKLKTNIIDPIFNLYSASGQVIKIEIINSENGYFEIQTNNIIGIYYLNIFGTGQQFTKKVLIK